MKAIFTVIVVCLFVHSGIAQKLTITGIIQDVNTANALANVSIQEEGTGTGIFSNTDGTYAIKVSNNNATLLFSHIGYNTLEVKLDNKNHLNIFLIPNTNMLTDVVVTALGIQRNKRELGYSIQTIRAKDLTEVRQTNLVNSLAGRVAGVQVTNGSSGIGSSARIVIRGENSLSGNNQPLFVIDGVPITNTVITNNTVNNEAGFQEVDYGNGAAEISPDDIESITILKGAGASALYGSRASGGVIVIKTKDGTNKIGHGVGVSLNSSVTFENPLRLPKYQNVYGAGSGGKFSYEDGFGAGSNDGGLTSFGPRLQGQLIKQFDGPSTDKNGNPVRGADIFARNGNPITPTPFIAHPNNIRDYFQTGATLINNISFEGYNDQSSFRVSYTNFNNKGIMPNTDLKRNSLAFSGTSKFNDRLSARTYINYIQSSSTNRPALGYGSENPMYTFNWSGRQVETKHLRNYWQAGLVGFNQFNSNYLWLDNPYFIAYENTNGFDKNRIIGNTSVKYNFSKNVSIRFSAGMDHYHDLRDSKRAFSTKRFANGAYREDEIDYNELNTDALVVYNKDFNKDLKMTLSAGGNILQQKNNYKSIIAGQLSVPGIYNFGNSKIPLISYQEAFKKRINSLYVFGNFDYRNYLFADITFRNDWSSTLPQKNNSYPYYSGSVSLILPKIVDLPEFISYSKLRLSSASVGGDTDPYQLNNTFVFNQNYGSSPLLTNSTGLLNPELIPEKLKALEAGAEVSFFKDRIDFDVSVYQNTNSNQIINLPVSSSSGYTTRLVNGGSVRSNGIELVLKATPLIKRDFKWINFINFSKNISRVLTLPSGVDQYVSGFSSVYSTAANSVFFIATPQNGGRIGDIYGTAFAKVNGQTLYDSKGFPVIDPKLQKLGNYNPNFMVGFGNEISYKNFDLNFLWDWRQGGVFLSRVFTLGTTSGILASTLPGRETGIVGQGVTNVSSATSPKYQPNTTIIDASDYYNTYFNRAVQATSMFDASYLKLRQVSLSYGIPKNILSRLKLNEIKLGFIMNNVLLFTKNPNVDPEALALEGRKYVSGVDNMSLPSSRSYGFNLNIKF